MPRIPIRYCWYFLIILHGIYFSYQLSKGRYVLKDSEEYILAGENLLLEGILYSGEWKGPKRIDFYTKRPPVYPALIGTVKWIGGFPFLLLLIQNVLSLVNFLLAWKLMQHLLALQQVKINESPFLPILIPLLILLYPAQFMYTNLVMTEILFQFLLTSGIFSLLIALHSQQAKYIIGYTLCLCLSIFTKPIMYLAAFPHLLGIGILSWRWRKLAMVTWAVIPLFLVLGYQLHNQQRTGYYHFSSIQNLSLFQYTTYNLLSQEYGAERATAMNDSVLEVMFTIPSYEGQQKLISSYSIGILQKHLIPYLAMHLKGMANFFLDPGRFDLYHFFGLEEVGGKGLQRTFSEEGYAGIWQYIATQPIGVLCLLGLILTGNLIRWGIVFWVLFNKRLPLEIRMVIGIFIVYVAGLTGTSGASRFAVPLFPISLGVVGYFWVAKNQLGKGSK
ncbi:MAG: hypothetical protein AAGA10_13545 [Bacteroidota bacterium]